MLFSGVRGTGKTTLARIRAKALNCERVAHAELAVHFASLAEYEKFRKGFGGNSIKFGLIRSSMPVAGQIQIDAPAEINV
ncbi:MAG: AAA family ATPase [Candidatus Electrothrix sp. YB6]